MKQRLHDVLEACQAIERVTAGLEFDDYMQNEAVRAGVQWFICVAGEALGGARQLDPELAVHLPELTEVVGMRNRLVHGYFTINDKTVWSTAKESVPSLQLKVESLLERD